MVILLWVDILTKEQEEKIEKLERQIRNLYQKRYRGNKEKQFDTLIGEVNKLGAGTIEVLKAMSEASISNPLLGIVTSMTFSDILYRAGVIDLATFTAIMVSVGALEGASIAEGVIEDVSSFFKVFGSQGKSTDPITPTAQTVVLGNKGKEDLQALMSELVKQ